MFFILNFKGSGHHMRNISNFDFESLKNVDIRTVDTDTLVDIEDIKVNLELPKQERIIDFVKQIKNPYCYKCGKVVVKVSFSDTNSTIEDRLESYLMTL